ncbi:MAG: cupin [Dehalococcoidia bacterium]|nr:cupin [Dehalococcoidia bacterium]
MTSVDQNGYVDWDAAPAKEVFPGVTLTIVSGEKIMFSRVDLGPDGVVPEHSHPHEQAGFVVSGEAEFVIDGEKRVLRTGDYYMIPGGVMHSARSTGRPTRCMDIFSPPREEYR